MHDVDREARGIQDDDEAMRETLAIDKWEAKHPSDAYLELMEVFGSLDRMNGLESVAPRNVIENLPARPPNREAISQMRRASGFVATSCPSIGDGEPHDKPKWRPYLSGSRWDPHERAWDAFQGRGTTATNRFKDMANTVDEFGLIRLELTLPPELCPDAWGEILEDGGGDFARLGDRFVAEAWDLMDLPGEPVGSWVSIHRTSSSLPHKVRPHLHVWAPAVYRDQNGTLQHLEREPGTQKPLFRPVEDLDRMREAWANLLEDHFNRNLDGTQNVHYRPLWVRDGRDMAKVVHGAVYNTRPHLEDVNDRLVDAGEKWVVLDVEDREDMAADTATIRTREFLGGILAVQALTPKSWQQSRYYGELSHRTWADFADEIGIPDPEEVTNTWDDLLEEGRAWAAGHEDRDKREALAWVRDEIAEWLLFEIEPEVDPPILPPDLAAAMWRLEDCAKWVTWPLAQTCYRCGDHLEQEALDRDQLVDVIEASRGEPPEPETDDHNRTVDQMGPNTRVRYWVETHDVEAQEAERAELRHKLQRASQLYDP